MRPHLTTSVYVSVALASMSILTDVDNEIANSSTPVTGFSDGKANVRGKTQSYFGSEDSADGNRVGSKNSTKRVPTTFTTWAPYCADVTAGNVSMACLSQTSDACPEGEMFASIYTYTVADATLVPTGERACIGDTDATPPLSPESPELVVLTASEFATLPIPPSKIETELDGFSLRNAHTNIYAASATRTLTTTILGQSVAVRAIPYEYRWTYGDGSTRTTTDPGAPVNGEPFETETATSHVYAETGDYPIGLTTVYTGQFSVAGGPWMPVAGMAMVPSPGVKVSVWRTKKILVDSSCEENPNGPGCSSPFDE